MDSGHAVAWPAGQAYNALLAQAKQDFADDPVVRALEPVRQSGTAGGPGPIAGVNAGSLMIVVGQLLEVYPDPH